VLFRSGPSHLNTPIGEVFIFRSKAQTP